MMNDREVLEAKVKLEPSVVNLVAYANILIQHHDDKELSRLIEIHGVWNPSKIIDYAVNETYFRSLPIAMREPKYMLIPLWSRVLEERTIPLSSLKNQFVYLDVLGSEGIDSNPLVLAIFFECWFPANPGAYSQFSYSEIYKANQELAEALNTMPQTRGAGKWSAPKVTDENRDFVIAEYLLDDEILFDLFTKSS